MILMSMLALKYRLYKGEVGKIASNLLERDFYADKSDIKWFTDVTEFSLFGQKPYLSPILDLYSQNLISYTITNKPVLSMENFFGLLKSELLYLQEFDSLLHFRAELEDYLDYYNNRRIKLKLNGLTPVMHRSQAISIV